MAEFIVGIVAGGDRLNIERQFPLMGRQRLDAWIADDDAVLIQIVDDAIANQFIGADAIEAIRLLQAM